MPDTPAYAAHDSFVAPARATAEIWRLAAGVGLAVATYVALLAAAQILLSAVLPQPLYQAFYAATASGSTALGALYLLTSFAFMGLAIAFVVRQLHQRAPLTLLGPPRLALRQGLVVLMALTLLSLVIWILPPSEILLPLPDPAPFAPWVIGALFALPALLIQTGAEELVFRGYLQQQIAARFRSPLLWMGIPAVLFALLHYRPEAGENALLLMGWAGIFSLMASDLTARSGSLGPAIALHFVTNAVAILFVAQDAALSGLALYRVPLDLSDPSVVRPALMIDLAIMAVSWLAARWSLRR